MRDEGVIENFRLRWRLGRTSPTPIADLREGTIAKVVGTVRAIEALATPFTGRECVCFRAAGYRSDGNQAPILIDDVERGEPFYVDDPTGSVRVDRKGYARIFAETFELRSGERHGASQHIERFIARYGRENASFFDGFPLTPADALSRAMIGTSDLVYYERAIAVGSRIAAIGVVRSTGEPAPDTGRAAGYRERRTLMQIEPPDDARLLLSEEAQHLS